MKFLALTAAILAPIAMVSAAAVAEEPTVKVQAAKSGQLYVKLNSASKLSDKDTFGKSDPFVEMWLDKDYKSRSKDTKGLNPVFDQTFCFYVRAGQDKLHVRAVDKDTFRNDKIGEASIPLANVMNAGTEGPKDYPLPKWLGFSSNGAVNMQMQFVPDSA